MLMNAFKLFWQIMMGRSLINSSANLFVALTSTCLLTRRSAGTSLLSTELAIMDKISLGKLSRVLSHESWLFQILDVSYPHIQYCNLAFTRLLTRGHAESWSLNIAGKCTDDELDSSLSVMSEELGDSEDARSAQMSSLTSPEASWPQESSLMSSDAGELSS